MEEAYVITSMILRVARMCDPPSSDLEKTITIQNAKLLIKSPTFTITLHSANLARESRVLMSEREKPKIDLRECTFVRARCR